MTELSNANPLRDYFESHQTGRGIYKWLHYFDVYHRHLARFCGTEVHILEIGAGSGGSLEMWRDYLGPEARVFGVDILEECKALEDDRIDIFVGDQADRTFWKSFRDSVSRLDVVIDDGGHEPEQQRISFEELFPFLSPGGVYLVEDIMGRRNEFGRFVMNQARKLNEWGADQGHKAHATNEVQRTIHSISWYPFVAVFEKSRRPVGEFNARKRGSEWLRPRSQPSAGAG